MVFLRRRGWTVSTERRERTDSEGAVAGSKRGDEGSQFLSNLARSSMIPDQDDEERETENLLREEERLLIEESDLEKEEKSAKKQGRAERDLEGGKINSHPVPLR